MNKRFNNRIEFFIGKWNQTIPKNNEENISMEFFSNGKLIYCIEKEYKKEIINLVFKIKQDNIITDQPSHPGIEKTKFRFIEPDKLELEYNGEKSIFKKVSL